MNEQRVLHGPVSQTGATTLSFFDHGTARHARAHARSSPAPQIPLIQGWAKKLSPGCESFSGQVEAEVEINSRNKFHETTYKIFLPLYDLYVPGELSRVKTDATSGQMVDKSFV